MIEVVMNNKYTSLAYSSESSDEFKPYKRTSIINTPDYIKNVQKSMSTTLGVLPNNCKIVDKVNNKKVYVIEFKPGVRTIKSCYDMESAIARLEKTGKLEEYGYTKDVLKSMECESNDKGETYYKFNLSFPYVVCIVFMTKNGEVSSFNPFFRMHPIGSYNDYLMYANLFNIPDGQDMCLGDVQRSFNNDAEAVNTYCNAFWRNGFSKDYTSNVKKYEEVQYVCDYLTWQYYTKVDPLFIYDINWIPYDKTIKGFINYKMHELSNQVKTFDEFISYLSISVLDSNNKAMKRNFTSETTLPGGRVISVGDDIKFGKKTFYINSFLGNLMEYDASQMEIEDEKGNKKIIPLNEKVKELISSNLIKSIESKEVDINGIIVKSGDILEIQRPIKRLASVKDIRITRDGRIEAKVGTDFYLLNNIEFSLFDKTNIKYDGVELNIGDKYYLTPNRTNCAIRNSIFNEDVKLCEFNGIDGSEININLLFSKGPRNINTSYNDNDYCIEKYDNSNTVKLVRAGNKLMRGDFCILNESIIINRIENWELEDWIKDIIFKSDSEVEFPSHGTNINFKVDDFVVIADWTKPELMRQPARIIEILYEDEVICFKLISLDGKKQFLFPYADLTNGKVFTGMLRKISLDCMGLRYGDELKANTRGIQNFPMKDINRVIGVITDTEKTPMVLCSNYCTIWAHEDELSKFDITHRNDPGWGKKKLYTPDISKIKIQAGDIIHDNDELLLRFICCNPNFTFYNPVLKEGGLRNIYRYNCFSTPDFSWNFHGIISPRYSRKNQASMRYRSVIPDMHNGFIEVHGEGGIKENWTYV